MPAHSFRVAPVAQAEGPSLIGLAALTRKAMRGEDLAPVARALLARLAADPRDAAALLDLSTIEQLLSAGANRISLQSQALDLTRNYRQDAANENAPTLLVLVAQGDFMANTPVEFLLEGANIQTAFLYVDAEMDILAAAPPHAAAFVAVAESVANQPILAAIAAVASRWPVPLLNAPEAIAQLTREGAWLLLHDAPGVIYPHNRLLSREHVLHGEGAEDFPFIIRPMDSHAGVGLEKIEDESGLSAYLQNHDEALFTTAPYIDYSGPDRLFRKMRIAMVDGAPWPAHLAVSPRWMIHYLNADMVENADNRAEEALFMANFQQFAEHHAETLAHIYERLQLDYFLIDCAEMNESQLLIFEVGSAMVAHDFDCPQTFPYKSAPMRRLFDAFQHMILSRAEAGWAVRPGEPA